MDVLLKRRSLEKTLLDSATPAAVAAKLELVKEVRQFANEALALPVGRSYSSFADLHRPVDDNFVVWNVFAAQELSTQAKQWCYPLIGCAHYRGFFSRKAATAAANRLQAQGYDTHIGGVKAYSTLGWFADPVLSTFVELPDTHLAGLIFHELAHKQVYIRDDTAFNESFATAVEIAAVKRWLGWRNEGEELQDYLDKYSQREAFVSDVAAFRKQLSALYSNPYISVVDKRQRKEKLFSQFRSRAHNGGPSKVFARRYANIHNNASLVPVQSYFQWVEAFQQLLKKSSQDLGVFYTQVKKLGQLAPEERLQRLQNLTDAARAP